MTQRIDIKTHLDDQGIKRFGEEFLTVQRRIDDAVGNVERFGQGVEEIMQQGRIGKEALAGMREEAQALVNILNLTNREMARLQGAGVDTTSQTQQMRNLQQQMQGNLSDLRNVPGAGEPQAGGLPGGSLLSSAWKYGKYAAAFMGVGYVANNLSGGMHAAAEHTIGMGTLGRRVSDPGASLATFHAEIIETGRALGVLKEETVQLAQTYSSRTGQLGNAELAGQMTTIQGFAKGMGMDVGPMGAMMGGFYGQGAYSGTQGMRQFAALLAEGVSRGGMQGRETEVMQGLSSLISTIQQRTLATPDLARLLSVQATMYGTGNEVLRSQGLNVLTALNQSIVSPGMGEAGELAMYRALNPTGELDYFDVQYLREKGITGVNPFTGATNLQALFEWGADNMPGGHAGMSMMANLTGLSMHQVEAMQNTFMQNGKFNSVGMTGLMDMLSPGQLETISPTVIPLLADLAAGQNPTDVMQRFGQLAGEDKVSPDMSQADLQQAIIAFGMKGDLLSSTDQLAVSITEMKNSWETLGMELVDSLRVANEFQIEAIRLAQDVINTGRSQGVMSGAGKLLGGAVSASWDAVFDGELNAKDVIVPGLWAGGAYVAGSKAAALYGKAATFLGGKTAATVAGGVAAPATAGATGIVSQSGLGGAVAATPYIHGALELMNVVSAEDKGAALIQGGLRVGGGIAGMKGGAALGALAGPFAPVAIPALSLLGYMAGSALGGQVGKNVGQNPTHYSYNAYQHALPGDLAPGQEMMAVDQPSRDVPPAPKASGMTPQQVQAAALHVTFAPLNITLLYPDGREQTVRATPSAHSPYAGVIVHARE